MKTIELLCSGDLKFKSLQELEKKYLQNINYFVKFSVKKIKEIKQQEEVFVREKETTMFLGEIKEKDYTFRPIYGYKQRTPVCEHRFPLDKKRLL